MAADDIVQRFAEAINRHDLDKLTAASAQDAVIHDPGLPSI